MSDNTMKAIKSFLKIPEEQQSNVDPIHDIEMQKGKRAKRIIDKKLTNQDYYKTMMVHHALLDHYENVDWYERDTQFDFGARN